MPNSCKDCPLLMDWCPFSDSTHQINLEHRPDWCPLRNENKVEEDLLDTIKSLDEENAKLVTIIQEFYLRSSVWQRIKSWKK